MCSDWAHSLIPLLIPSVKLNKNSEILKKSGEQNTGVGGV